MDEGNGRTAILLLDFQNEFAKEGGKLHSEVSEMMQTTGMLRNVPKLVEFARKTETMIIYSPVVMEKNETFEDNTERRLSISFESKKGEYNNQFGLFTENTWNCEIIHELEPRNDDIILTDRMDFSAFAGTRLQAILETNNIQHFFIMGYLTDVCVYQTANAAARFLPNISTYVVSDGCAAKSLKEHQNALQALSKEEVEVITCSETKAKLEYCAAQIRKSSAIDGESDEWLLINKIFSAAGVDRNGTVSFEILKSLIGSETPSRSSFSRILSQSIIGSNTSTRDGIAQTFSCDEEDPSSLSVDRESLRNILFQRKKRSGFFEMLPLHIIMGLLPLFYSMSTRLPFIFLALEIRNKREGTLWHVAAALGSYQTCRAFGNMLIVTLGGYDPFRRLHVLMVSFGLFGWLFSALYQRNSSDDGLFLPNFGSDTDNTLSVWPLFALLGVGFSESVVNLQRSLMIETTKESPTGIIDKGLIADRLGLQYAFVAFGSVLAYVGGGQVYTHYGFRAICELGVLCHIIQLIGTITYICLSKRSKRNVHHNSMDGNDLIRSVIYQFQTASVVTKYSRSVARGTESALNTEEELSDFDTAARKAKDDHVLIQSLRETFQAFFEKKNKSSDDVASMEKMLISFDSAATDVSMATKRPLAVAIHKEKLAKLILYLMKTRGKLTENEFVSFWAPRVYLSMFQSSQEASVNVVWPYMKVVVATQAVMALCIGTFLSTSLLSYTERFNIDADMVGLLLGIGEFLGSIAILGRNLISKQMKKRGRTCTRIPDFFGAICSRPLHVPFVLIITSISSMCFSIPNFGVAILSQMIMSSLNDTSVTLLNELIGTSLPAEKFKVYQGMGQWLRRLGNMLTGVLGPLLFGIHQSFPFVFFGFIVFAWSIILFYFMYLHAEKMKMSQTPTLENDGNQEKRREESCFTQSVILAPFIETIRTPWHTLEQRYYSLNKEEIEEELQPWSKAQYDITLLEHQVRRIAATLEVEKDQRRALEDRMYAKIPQDDDKVQNIISS